MILLTPLCLSSVVLGYVTREDGHVCTLPKSAAFDKANDFSSIPESHDGKR